MTYQQPKFGLSNLQVKILSNIFESYKDVKKVLVFGSRAIGNYKPFSDIDLCIVDSKLEKSTLFYLKDEFQESNLIYKVDLHNFDDLQTQKFKDRILKDGVVIYEA